MRRRDFLEVLSGVIAAPFVLRSSAAQPAAGTRAAVVIGVNKAGDLPVLRAAASGARAMERWLKSEGFDVKPFVDDAGPIRAHMVHDAIANLVTPGALDQLVIYFAGHGFLNAGRAETWLLSDAPASSSEAINVEESMYASRESGLKNIVFISDACRSTPDSLRTSRVQGYVIFPNLAAVRPRRPEVDRFFAALPGKEANEVSVTDSAPQFEGIYTSAFMGAFQQPEADMIRKVSDVNVVPNRMLKSYLLMEVPKRAQARALRLNQKPDAIIESDESTYIGRVAPDAVTARSPIVDAATLMTVGHASEQALKTAGINALSDRVQLPPNVVDGSSENAAFQNASNRVLNARPPASLENRSGITVVGVSVEFVVGGPRSNVERLQNTDGSQQIILTDLRGRRGASVIIGFKGGGGTVVAALADFVATVVVDQGRVVNVSYVPSHSAGGTDLSAQEKRIQELRATVAASAQFGVFRIEGDRQTRKQRAGEFADHIRIGKGFDPTLGLYAAYAYADADIVEEVRSVREYMRGDLGIDVFDVAMLAGQLPSSFPAENTVPFCPMLSQGWNLLRVKGVRLAPDVQRARDQIRPALWTTFQNEGLRTLAAALAEGRVM